MPDDSPKTLTPPRVKIQFRNINTPLAYRRAKLRVINAQLAGLITPMLANSAHYGLDGIGRSLEAERTAEQNERLLARQDALEAMLTGRMDARRLIEHGENGRAEH